MKTIFKDDRMTPINEQTAREYLEKLAQESPDLTHKRREARERIFREAIASYEATKKRSQSEPQS